MFNAKWGFICGGVAFVLAFITSLVFGHTGFLIALARAGGFAILFFGLGAGIWALISTFIPELLNVQEDAVGNVFSQEASGARVNITLDDTPDAALPAAMPAPMSDADREAADLDELGNFNDLISQSINPRRDIDQSPATGYTTEDRGEFVPAFDSSPDTSPGISLDSVKVEGLGDFSMDFGAFVPEGGKAADSDLFSDPFSSMSGSGDSVGAEGASPPSEAPQRKSSSNKTAQLDGDFDPKEIAAGIRTVMEKDKKG